MFWRRKKENHLIKGMAILLIFMTSSVSAFSWDDNYFNNRSLSQFFRYILNMDLPTPPSPLIENIEIPYSFPESVTFNYNGKSVTYGTIPYAGLVWMDRNLGAQRVAEDKEDELGFGDYFQWGREADGHQFKSSPLTELHELADEREQPGDNRFIIVRASPLDWNHDSLWQDRWIKPGNSSGVNICPDDWHVPTIDEWIEMLKVLPENTSDKLYEVLKLPTAGYRRNFDGKIQFAKAYGHYWSSDYKDQYNSRSLMYNFKSAYKASRQRALGLSVRCVMNPPVTK